MPGFFSRLFRRRSSNANNGGDIDPAKKKKKDRSRNKKAVDIPVKISAEPEPPFSFSKADNRSSPTEPDDELPEAPPLTMRPTSPNLVTLATSRSVTSPPPPPLSSSSANNNSLNHQYGTGSFHSPRNNSVSSPIDLDDESVIKDVESDMEGQENASPRMFSMSPATENLRFSAGFNHHTSDNDTASDAESSSFNLSTDAEDTEYEALKRRGILPITTQDTNTYNTDGETSVFPNLQTDDEEDNTIISSEVNHNGSVGSAPSSSRMHIVSVAPPPSHNKWGGSSTSYPNTVNSMHGTVSPRSVGSSNSNGNKNRSNNNNANNAFSQNALRRPFTTPKQSPLQQSTLDSVKPISSHGNSPTSPTPADDPFQGDPFADFADFANFDVPATSPTSWNGEVNFDAEKNNSSKHVGSSDHSLSDLLAQAKSKSRNRGSRSVNSAPVHLTSQYLREHHNLKPYRGKSRTSENGSGNKSVSDIIKNLEAPTPAVTSTSSGHHKSSRRSRKHDAGGSSSDSEESWLMDEVTGALGPRGIAADLESLSGRSRSSGGGRSHRSHKSRSRHRRKKSCGESVDSVGSRKSSSSKRSRSSRYSHRSTRSYISQMSEQSRSVANDLLRLEMQLAMVGTTNSTSSRDETRSRGNNGTNTSARPSHRRTAARRSRISVLAPPGKLGIILANKADSKGTVVSGVRTSSVLSEKISPGDRIVAIDEEDVSMMTVSEITTIMARKSEFERMLTVLTTPRQLSDGPEYSHSRYR